MARNSNDMWHCLSKDRIKQIKAAKTLKDLVGKRNPPEPKQRDANIGYKRSPNLLKGKGKYGVDWTNHEHDFLVQNAGKIPAVEIAATLQRSLGSINGRAARFGLSTAFKRKAKKREA